MRRQKKAPEGEAGGMERWLITYADLITLLLIFFIVMYTMSKVDAAKFEAVAQSLSQVLQGRSNAQVVDAPGPSFIQGQSGAVPPQSAGADSQAAEQKSLEEIARKLSQEVQKDGKLAQNVVIYQQERGLVISFKDAILFPSGSATLLPESQDILLRVVNNLKDIPNYIRVEGHTDNRPINNARFPSNWELSVLRATNVLHLMVDNGIEANRISATGYGEYRPIVPNRSDKEMGMNRRVDIVILKEKYGYFEPASQ
ncbi:MAG: flagellar motor protein MotB [Methylocystaceae bacterium]